MPTGAGAAAGADRALDEALRKARLTRKQIRASVTTGYGRGTIEMGESSVTEISCHARGAHYLDPSVRTVIDIGGQDSKVIRMDNEGNVVNFVMNDKCAAGTGRFLEMMARVLEINIDDMGGAGLSWKEDLVISSMCTVFAESEVVSLIARNKPVSDIVHALNKSVAARTASLYRRVNGGSPVLMTGGVARNNGVVEEVSRAIGTDVISVPDSQLCGAIGAALYAIERVVIHFYQE